MRRMAVVLALVMTWGGLASEPAAARTYCGGTRYVETFDVTAEARQSVYRIGETAVVDLFVTDSVTGMRVSDADAGVMIRGRKDKWLFAVDKTGAEGHVVLRLHLKRSRVERGWARTMTTAWESINTPAYCTGRYGYREYPRLFRIRG